MPKYELRTNKITLIEGQQVTPEDVLATIELHVAANPRDVLSMVQFRNATLVCLDDPAEESEDPQESGSDLEGEGGSDGDSDSDADDEDDDEADTGGTAFANLNAKQQESLAVEGITSLSQASMWLASNHTFEKLDHIGRATNLELVELIREAGFPVPEKY